MIDKATRPHLTHATGNNFTRRKRAGEGFRRSRKELRDPQLESSTPPGEPFNFVVDFVNERWVEFAGLSSQNAFG